LGREIAPILEPLNRLDNILFELIQVAIGNRVSLSQQLSAEEWGELRLLFKKQALLGIGYVGITRLPQEQCPPIQILAQWVHNAEKIRKKNQKVTEACVGVCQLLEHDGFNTCILKGQSNLVNYRPSISPFHSTDSGQVKGDFPNLADYRTPGDVDVLCWPKGEIEIAEGDDKSAHYVKYTGRRAVIEYVLLQHRLKTLSDSPLKGESSDGKKSSPFKGERGGLEVNYHHVDWSYGDTPVEVHYRASWLNNPFANARLQRWTEENKDSVSRYCPPGSCGSGLRKSEGVAPGYSNTGFQPEQGFPIPTASFNVVYQLVHINRHLFNEGIGLRQILDYYFVLKTLPTSLIREETMQTLRSFHLAKFAGALMWVLQEAFAMPSEYLLCPPDERRGRFLLNEIMLAGNFGRYDERNVIAANESYVHRFIRRQKRFLRFLTQYPSEVLWAPYFSVTQRLWRMWHGWR